MGDGSRSSSLRLRANCIIALFISIQVALVLRGALPWPGKGLTPWPWSMFDRANPWERVLRAAGTDRAGARRELPLERVFGYTGGATTLYAYQNVDYLDDPTKTAERAEFAAFLARRMAELGIELSTVDLRWLSTHVVTGETDEQFIGTFDVSARQ